MVEMSSLSVVKDGGAVVPPHSPNTRSMVALVVTPDAEIRKHCEDAAMAAGLAVECTERGVSALNLARTLLPELIILDVELRDVHGLELVTWLRTDTNLRHVPVIAISTFAGDCRDPRLGNNSGVIALISKPVHTKDLDKLVRRAI